MSPPSGGAVAIARAVILRVLFYGLLLAGAVTMVQDHLLYFPERIPLPALMEEARRDDLRSWPLQGEWRGLMREPDGPARGTFLLFHGNAGHAGHRAAYADLSRLGLRVVLAEYPGYGPREGKPGEASMVADAVETIRQVRRDFPGPLLLAGESLGAGVAAAAHARAPDAAAAVLLITPWDTLANVARHHYPWLPVDLLLRDRYDSLANLAGTQVPVTVVIAERDSIVPAEFGRALHDGLRSPKRLLVIPGADHNDWMDRVDRGWWQTVTDFRPTGA